MFTGQNTQQLQEKWSKVLDHQALNKIDDPHKRAVLAQLLENQEVDNRAQARQLQNGGLLTEATPTNVIGNTPASTGDVRAYNPILISLVRRAMPNLIAYDICGVQPMTGPTGLIFAMRARYDSTASTATEALFNEALTSKAGDSTVIGGDSGAEGGNYDPFTDSVGGTTSRYGFYDGIATNIAQGNISGEMGFSIERVSVTAQSRQLKASYSLELAQDLQALHGLNAETELANILSTEILAEINREIVRRVNYGARLGAQTNTASAGTFNLDTDSNGRWMVEKFKGMLFQIERDCNQIAKDTRRGKGNFIICSSDVASALVQADILDYTPALNSNLNVDDTGNTFAGTINGKLKVYVDPYFASSQSTEYFTVGYKGANAIDAGLFYCPYVPLQMVRAVDESSFQPKIAFKTRYGVVANPFANVTGQPGTLGYADNKYYRIVRVRNLM